MRRFLIRGLAALGTCAVVVSAGALTASASAPSDTTLFLTQHDDFTPITWAAFGDSGVWDRGLIRIQGGKSPVFAGMIETFETNDAKTGSFEMNFQGLGYNATGAVSGTWVIGKGTGIYAGIHGTGTWYEVDIPDPNNVGHLLFTFPCTGTVHFD